MARQVESFFDPDTFTWTHVVWDSASNRAAIIDPVLNYHPESGRTGTRSVDLVVGFVNNNALQVDWIFETHAHADHLTGAEEIKQRLGGTTAIGAGICEVQETFREIYNLGTDFPVDGRQFDRLLSDGDRLKLGELEIVVISTPGHTNDSMSLRVDDAVFVGDTLFGPAYGTARCDFPGGDARLLYRSIKKLLSLPADTMLYLCHDYPAEGQQPRACASVAEQQRNTHLRQTTSEAGFVAMRESRDKELDLPRLLLPAIQVNLRAGRLPEPEANGVSYLKIPLDRF